MYTILEIQKFSDGTAAYPPVVQKSTLNEGKSEFYRVASLAAISSVPKHIVILISDDGDVIAKDITIHSSEQNEGE